MISKIAVVVIGVALVILWFATQYSYHTQKKVIGLKQEVIEFHTQTINNQVEVIGLQAEQLRMYALKIDGWREKMERCDLTCPGDEP